MRATKLSRSELRALREANEALSRPDQRFPDQAAMPLVLVLSLCFLLILVVTAYL